MNSKSTLYCVFAFVLGTVFLYMGFHSMKENSQFREKGQRAMFTPATNEYTEHRERRGGGVYLSAEQPQTRPLPKRGGRQPLAIVPDRPGGIRLYCHDGGEGAPRESV